MDVMIFDDDPHIAGLLAAVLEEMGLSARAFYSGEGALQRIRQHRPRLVILDIMMPGMDGLSLCKKVKADPDGAGIKVLIVSAKGFRHDREQALRFGADGFVVKPFDVEKLVRGEFQGLLPQTRSPAAAEQSVLRVRVWGGRGPAEGGGGRVLTSCVSLELGERLLILDGGTGLGDLCSAPAPAQKHIWCLLTHYHADHISGLPALRWVSDPAYQLSFLGPSDPEIALADVLQKGLPAAGGNRARISLSCVQETRFALWPDVTVSTLFTRHPGSTLAYRIEYRGRCVVYCPDGELESEDDVQTDYNEKLAAFVRAADLLIHDARFMDADLVSRRGLGHSAPALAAGLAARAGVRKLALFHMDESYGPEVLSAALRRLRESLRQDYSTMGVELGIEKALFEV